MRVLLIQDICVIGKNSANVTIPLFSAMGIEVVFVPVFIQISKWDSLNKNNFDSIQDYDDLSFKFKDYSDYFTKNKIHFDCIFINGNFSQGQVEKINELVDSCFTNDCIIVLGSDVTFSLLRKFYGKANVVISDLSKLLCLFEEQNTDENSDISRDKVRDKVRDKAIVENIMLQNSNKFRCSVVGTGLFINEKKSGIAILENRRGIKCGNNNGTFKWLYHNNYISNFHGLNDIFSAVVTGVFVKSFDLEKAVRIGIDFTEKAVKNTLSKPDHNWYGADFESILPQLTLQLSDS